MSEFESWYWWYVTQRENVLSALRALQLPQTARVLDAGCGTGFTLRCVAESLQVNSYGIDACVEAARQWSGDRPTHLSLASINDLPFADDSFDAVFCVDVVGCRGVDPQRATQQMTRVLRPEGHLILLAPAYQWLRSRHDSAVGSIQRFTRKSLQGYVARAGLQTQFASHRFAAFFPMIALMRLATRFLPGGPPKSDLGPLPSWLNRWLLRIALLEQQWMRNTVMPFGTTILIVARKPTS